ncbi:acyltransferase family protein [Pseudobutyrivibrio sp. MD2005]|uniref:acyltransferase family protein n=1 Tax=Pseudobutyrivibrio sp. MD2005 TaxID=1410616 RepID=UPI00048613B3|nr:acyltransferase family protein [Pseudobutyrivibrio sp. MD2005]
MQHAIKRDSNIELLRIISIIGVFILHQNGGIISQSEGVNTGTLYLLECFFIGSVNLFMLISGYFMSERHTVSIWKAVNLLFMVSFFKFIRYFTGLYISGGVFELVTFLKSIVPSNQFINLYLTVYIFSPFIGFMTGKLSREQMKRLLIIEIILFSIIPTFFYIINDIFQLSISTLWTVTVDGAASGYSVVNYFLMFSVGIYIRRYGQEKKFTNLLLKFGVCVVLLFFLTVGAELLHEGGRWTIWAYCNPLVIWIAVLWFELFRKFKFKSYFINHLSRSVIVMFLIHRDFFTLINMEYIATENAVLMVMHILGNGLVIYMISWGIWAIYINTIEKILILFEKGHSINITCE